MRRTRTNQEDEFYADLDKETEKQSSCSCYSLAIFFILLFCLLAALMIHFLRDIRPTKIDLSNVTNSITDQIQSQTNSQEPAPTLFITQEELTALMQNGLKGSGGTVSNLSATIDPSSIKLTGKVDSVINLPIEMQLAPTVLENKLHFKITKFQSWRVSLPGVLRSSIEDSLNKLMDENLSTFYQKYNVTDVQLSTGKMTIFGKQRS